MQRVSYLVLFGSACLLAAASARAAGFSWQDGEGETTLLFDGRPAIRYMHLPYDNSTSEKRDWSFKPFHHVWSPDGATRLTKGDPGGLYPHHRGLFFGFNKVTYGGGKQCDVWHCTRGAHQAPAGELERSADEHGAHHRVAIDWYANDEDVFAHEVREVRVTRPEHNGVAGWQIDFTSHVRTADDQPIHLDGDPQHAGFHFRASQEVPDKTAKQTYYLRTDGKGEPGDYRNWDPKAADSAVPTIRVVTNYPGAEPPEVESKVSQILEDAVASVAGLDGRRSLNTDGMSTLTLTFRSDQDINVAIQDVRDAIAGVMNRLPPGSDPPVVQKQDRDASSMNQQCENRPWNAASFVIGDQRYTVLYMDHPTNPKPARYSERDYARFGSYFAADVTKENPLKVKYRVWVQPGEMTQDQCHALSMVFNLDKSADAVTISQDAAAE